MNTSGYLILPYNFELAINTSRDGARTSKACGVINGTQHTDLPGLIWSRMNVSVTLDRNQGGHGHAQETVHTRRGLQHLRTVELDTGKGLAVLDACRKLGITKQKCGRSF